MKISHGQAWRLKNISVYIGIAGYLAMDCEGEPNSAGAIAKMQAIGLAKARGASEWIRDLLGIEQGGGCRRTV